MGQYWTGEVRVCPERCPWSAAGARADRRGARGPARPSADTPTRAAASPSVYLGARQRAGGFDGRHSARVAQPGELSSRITECAGSQTSQLPTSMSGFAARRAPCRSRPAACALRRLASGEPQALLLYARGTPSPVELCPDGDSVSDARRISARFRRLRRANSVQPAARRRERKRWTGHPF